MDSRSMDDASCNKIFLPQTQKVTVWKEDHFSSSRIARSCFLSSGKSFFTVCQISLKKNITLSNNDDPRNLEMWISHFSWNLPGSFSDDQKVIRRSLLLHSRSHESIFRNRCHIIDIGSFFCFWRHFAVCIIIKTSVYYHTLKNKHYSNKNKPTNMR